MGACSRKIDAHFSSFSRLQFEDALWQGLTDQHIKMPMGITAENLGEKYGITRNEVDDYALKSQKRWSLGAFSFAFCCFLCYSFDLGVGSFKR